MNACKQVVATNLALPTSIKAKLEAVCDKAATSNAAELKAAGEKVCDEAIGPLHVPASVKQRALADCTAASSGGIR